MTDMVTCLLCNSNETYRFKVGEIGLVGCHDCTGAFLEDIPTEQVLDTYYQTEYQITSADYLEAEKRRMFRLPEQVKLVAQLSQRIPPPGTVLDIGCDKGYFLDEMRRLNYTVRGVEPSQNAREYCRRIGIDTVAALDEVDGAFDIITMWHVLEHVADPQSFLATVLNHLNPGGLLAVRVPDFACFWRKVFRRRWIWFQPENHYAHYSDLALAKVLESSGFENISVERGRPNNRLTARAYRLTNAVFRRFWQDSTTFGAWRQRRYEDFTGYELFALATKPPEGSDVE